MMVVVDVLSTIQKWSFLLIVLFKLTWLSNVNRIFFFFFLDLGSIMRLFANILACLRPNKKNIYLVANNFLDYLTPD
jgi:hypothetical protein